MAPGTAVMMLSLCLFYTIVAVWQFPMVCLGLLMGPLVRRQTFLIEFLYPTSLGRWVHLFLVRLVSKSRLGKKSPNDKNRGCHSRSLETRVEVVPGRVFIHPLPQFLDNVGYLVVCLPDKFSVDEMKVKNGNGGDVSLSHHSKQDIVAFVVDCGNASEVSKHIDLISETHYSKRKILVQQILSTHKHHDHTAGNLELKKKLQSIVRIVGGAVERIPGCNLNVVNGSLIQPLPRDGNNRMEDLVEVEAVATPGHTRGSITYVLRPVNTRNASGLAYLFTGDTMFCGGAGVPFEADVDANQEVRDHKRDFRSLIKASASSHAVERSLVEILVRSVQASQSPGNKNLAKRIFVMPGHEYTGELLSRQFTDTVKWKSVTPSTFFATASQLYIALHRRTLPHSSGKLLCAVGSPLEKELSINPFLRTLRSRGELVLQAIRFWHTNFCKKKVADWIPSVPDDDMTGSSQDETQRMSKTPATATSWNLNGSDLNRSVFTTVFSADLEALIQDLSDGKLSPNSAAQRLRNLSKNLEVPTLARRPIPGTMPSDRNVYRGLLALVLLGSSPTALTYGDAEGMNLPAPVRHSNDIEISRSRLVAILKWLKLIGSDNEGRRNELMIRQLWKESYEDSGEAFYVDNTNTDASKDVETSSVPDLLKLVDLKWSIYGVPRKPPSPLGFCLPCLQQPRRDTSHPVHQSGLKPSSGEIVRHDVIHCFICQAATGCPHGEKQDGVVQEGMGSDRPVLAQYGSMEEDDGVEVTSMVDQIFHITPEGGRALEL
jgi:hydroxyacylglutathione hydrolase